MIVDYNIAADIRWLYNLNALSLRFTSMEGAPKSQFTVTTFDEYKKRLRNDVIICIVIMVVSFAVFSYYQVFELILDWVLAPQQEYIELDEIILSLALGSVVFSWFAYRRWRELKSELIASKKLNIKLNTALEARKKGQSALALCWTRFVDIAAMSQDWIWESDENHVIKYMSDHFFTETGMDRNMIQNRSWDDIGIKSGLKKLRGKFKSRQPFSDVKISMPTKDGKTTQWSITGKPVFDDAGEFMGYRGVGASAAQDGFSDDKSDEVSGRLEEFINLAVMEEAAADGAKDAVQLTPREGEILDWVRKGKSYAQIAEILSISRRTVEFHIKNVMDKLGASNRVSAVVIAMRRGILGA